MLPGLLVRVISKKVAKGKLYNSKVRITDVLSDSRFLAVPLQGESMVVYDDLREKDIETVIPRENGQEVCILKGEYKGEHGKML